MYVYTNIYNHTNTVSGYGGAVFAQSAGITVINCTFHFNNALTGQFDAGSAGGALVLEDCYPSIVQDSKFTSNGAAGYYGNKTIVICLY